MFAHEGFVALDFGERIFGVRGMAFLAGAVALAFGVVDGAEYGFARFFRRFRESFGVAADAGAIAMAMMDGEGFAVFSLDESAVPIGGIVFGFPVWIGTVFGVAFAADATTRGDLDISWGFWKRIGTNGHELRFGFRFRVWSFELGAASHGRDARATMIVFCPGEVGAAAVVVAELQAG